MKEKDAIIEYVESEVVKIKEKQEDEKNDL